MRQLLTDLRGNPIYTQRRLRRTDSNAADNRGPFVASTLVCMVQNRAWEDVLKRCRTHPQECSEVDPTTGNTPLHLACRLDPPPAVVAAMKSMARMKNHQDATPLHIAASHRCSAQALKVLLACGKSLDEVIPEDDEEEDREDEDTLTCDDLVLPSVSPTADLSRMGRAPIHYACMSFRGLDIEAFKVLLDATLRTGYLRLRSAPDAIIDVDSIDELESVFFDESTVGNDVLINVMSMKDATGQTPLGLLFRRYRERVRHVIANVDKVRVEHAQAPDRAALAAAMSVHADLGELWEKARHIVAQLEKERLQRETGSVFLNGLPASPAELAISREAASWAFEQHTSSEVTEELPDEDAVHLFSGVEEAMSNRPPINEPEVRPFRIVHASVGLTGYGCPPEMIRLAISIHPHQVREMDEDGNLPIHIAAQASNFLANADEAEASNVISNLIAAEHSDDMSVLSDAFSFFSSATVSQTTNPFDKVIKILLQHYPEGARTPQGRSGHLPLVLAVEAGVRTWNDGVRTLLHAYPPALHNKKLVEPLLYPEVLSLVTNAARADPECSGDFPNPTRVRRSQLVRQAMGARSTLFQLLRTKPEWLTEDGWGLEEEKS